MRIPNELMDFMRPVTVIVGHYGSGKTNFTMNLAVDLREAGNDVTVIDLDVVNPYFRASEQRGMLEAHGVRLIAPVFAEAASSLDVPSLTGGITPAIQDAREASYVLVDAGGDDVGATALGRFARAIASREYAMLYVANRFRNLVQDTADAIENMREIEGASHLRVSAIANNSHLKDATTEETIRQGERYANELAEIAELPLCCTTVPLKIADMQVHKRYPVESFVKNPWE